MSTNTTDIIAYMTQVEAGPAVPVIIIMYVVNDIELVMICRYNLSRII